jgi:uncharacterized protein YbjT (DUF2867 family)
MKHLLVLGASGFVGRHLCEALNRTGLRVLAPTRRLPARSIQTLPFVDVVQADLFEPQVLEGLMKGADAVVNLVATLHATPEGFERLHVDLARRVAQCARQAHVRQVVQVSALGVSETEPGRSHYLRSKTKGEQVMRQALEGSSTALTVLRPSVIFAKDDRFINLLAQLQQFFPFFPLASPRAQFQPVWVGDVATAMVRVITAQAQAQGVGATPLAPTYELATRATRG